MSGTIRPAGTSNIILCPLLSIAGSFFGSAAALSLSAASYANVSGANDRVRVGVPRLRRPRAGAHRSRQPPRGAGPGSRRRSQCATCGTASKTSTTWSSAGRSRGGATRRGCHPSARKCRLDPADRTRVTKDYRRLLDLKDVDAVCIATPDHWHGRMTVDALDAGKDVYVEKPMTRRAEEAIAVLDAWQRTGRVVTVGVQSMADARVGESLRSRPHREDRARRARPDGRVPQRRPRAVAVLPARRTDEPEDDRLGPLPRPSLRAGGPIGRPDAARSSRSTARRSRSGGASPTSAAGRSPICSHTTSRTRSRRWG